ncbi:hypothetical protein ALC62_06451, partial [Cyphomyrmex costatus]
ILFSSRQYQTRRSEVLCQLQRQHRKTAASPVLRTGAARQVRQGPLRPAQDRLHSAECLESSLSDSPLALAIHDAADGDCPDVLHTSDYALSIPPSEARASSPRGYTAGLLTPVSVSRVALCYSG